MEPLAKALGQMVNMTHVPDAASAIHPLRETLRPGDAVLVKGSNSVGLAAIIEALTSGSSAKLGTGKS
jgi:UDP-N-acetylmuramoyl-tripeptide--D-alanyl-D-alanine ligase